MLKMMSVMCCLRCCRSSLLRSVLVSELRELMMLSVRLIWLSDRL